MWDSFMSGVSTSIMRNLHKQHGENEFSEMHYMDITVVTSNKPYGISDGSNKFFDGRKIPKFNLKRNGVHSGHVQTGIQDPFCLQKNGTGRCKVSPFRKIFGNVIQFVMQDAVALGLRLMSLTQIVQFCYTTQKGGRSWT